MFINKKLKSNIYYYLFPIFNYNKYLITVSHLTRYTHVTLFWRSRSGYEWFHKRQRCVDATI